MVLARRKGEHVLAVRQHDEARLFAVQEFFDHDAVARGVHRPLDEELLDCTMSFVRAHRDDYALSRR